MPDVKFGLKVKLDVKEGAVDVTVRRKEDEGDWDDLETQSFSGADISSDLTDQVYLYGMSKLLQDRSSDVATGPDKLEAMQVIYAQLCAGQWERERVAGAPTVSAEVEALAQLKRITIPQAQKALRRYSKDQRQKILGNDDITKLAAKIKTERASAEQVDLDDLAS